MIKKAKVPIVKFVHASSGIQMDVCFNQQSGLTSGEAAKAMMRQMQPVGCYCLDWTGLIYTYGSSCVPCFHAENTMFFVSFSWLAMIFSYCEGGAVVARQMAE